MRRRVAWAGALIVIAVTVVVAALDEEPPKTPAERAAQLNTEFACPVCDGQSVAESNAPVAQTIRLEIARQVDSGASDAEIEVLLVDRYGEAVLLTPSSSGVVGLVWIVPVVALVLSLAGLALAFRRWRTRPIRGATREDAELVEAARGSG